MSFYDSGKIAFAVAADLTTAKQVMSFVAPEDMAVDFVGASITTAPTSGTANSIQVGTTSDADAYATLDLTDAAADSAVTAATVVTEGDNGAINKRITKGSIVTVNTVGAPAAGAADLTIVFRPLNDNS